MQVLMINVLTETLKIRSDCLLIFSKRWFFSFSWGWNLGLSFWIVKTLIKPEIRFPQRKWRVLTLALLSCFYIFFIFVWDPEGFIPQVEGFWSCSSTLCQQEAEWSHFLIKAGFFSHQVDFWPSDKHWRTFKRWNIV